MVDYKLSLQVDINPQGIEKQLQTLSSQYRFKLKADLDFSDLKQQLDNFKSQLGQIQQKIQNSGNGKGFVIFDRTTNDQILNELQQKLIRIKETADKNAKLAINTTATPKGEQLTKSVMTYSDGIGKTVVETLKWKTAQDGVTTAIGKTTQYIDNMAKTEKKFADEFSKANSLADTFLGKAERLSKSDPNVAKGIDLSSQIKALTSKGLENLGEGEINKVTALRKELEVTDNVVRAGGKNLQNWTTELGLAIKRTVEWFSAIGLVHGAIKQLKEGVQYVSELNKEMTAIQIVTGMNSTEIQKLTYDYNGLAKELGATTKEVAAGSAEWFRQGKTVEETEQMLRATMMMSKLGNIESAQATEYLTSTLNGYKMSAEDAITVVDKLTAVDNATATSVAELATALQKTSNLAAQSGVTFDQLVSYIATVSAVTRKSADTIGTSFQAMFSRLENIKLNKVTEEGETLNDVEKVLARINIRLRENETTFRPMSNVLSDVAAKWSTLNDIEKASVGQAIAGTRQRENFIVLMNNFNKTLELQTVQSQSAGLGLQRYGIYLESVEASSNKLKATWESLWSKTIDPKVIIFFNNLLSKVLQTINAVGGLVPVVLGLVSAFAVLKGQAIVGAFTTLGRNIVDIILKFQTLGATATVTGTTITTVMGGIGLAIAAVVAIINIWNLAVEDNVEKVARLSSEIDELTSSLNTMNSQKKNLEDLSEEFNSLQSKTNKSTEEQKRWTEIQNQIKEILPEVNGYYNDQGDYIIDNTVAIKDLIEAKQKEINAEKELLALKAQQSISARIQQYGDLQKQLNKTIDYYNLLKKASDSVIQEGYGYSGDQKNEEILQQDIAIKEYRVKLQQTLAEIKKDFYSLPQDQQQAFLQSIDVTTAYGKQVYDALTNVQSNWKDSTQAIAQYTVQFTQEVYKGLYGGLKELEEFSTGLYNIAGKQRENGISYSDVSKLIETNKDYVDLLYVENGSIQVNTDKIRELTVAKAEQALRTAESTGASEKELEILRNYVDQTKRAIPLSREFADGFQAMMVNTVNAMGENITPEFEKLGMVLNENSQLFEEGKIKSSEYVKTLQENLQGADFGAMFGQNKDAAQTFFSGLTLNAAQAISQISSEFDAGEITLSEYTQSLEGLGNVFETIGQISLNYIDTLGITGQAANEMRDAVTNALGSIGEGTEELANLQQLNTELEQEYFRINEEGLEWASQANQEYLMSIAEAASASGQSFTDMAGNALSGTQQIFGYISQSQANFSNFATQAAQKSGGAMQKVVQGVGKLLQTLGNQIKNFKAGVNFQPKLLGGYTKIPFKVGPMSMDFLEIPNVGVDIKGDASSLANIGQALADFGADLADTTFDFDNGIYDIPGGGNQVTDTAKSAKGAYKDLGRAIKDVNDAAKKGADDQKKALNELEKAIKRVIEAEKRRYKEKLEAMKRSIDEQKDALDWEEKERDYQDEVAEKTKSIADLEAEIAELALDDSEAAMAKRLKLEEELAKKRKELADDQRHHDIDEKKKALDDEYKLYKDEIDKKIKDLEDMLDKIESITADTVEELVKKLKELGITVNVETGEIETHHKGLLSGPVGGQSSSNGEVMAKLLKGEWVLGENDINKFINKTIPGFMNMPQTQSNVSGGGFNIGNLINIEGNADPSMLPDLENIAKTVIEKLNEAMGLRGIRRNVNSFGL